MKRLISVPFVVLLSTGVISCVTSSTRDATYEQGPEGKPVITAETEHTVRVFSVKNLDNGFTQFDASWDGNGGVDLSTTGNVEGLQITSLDELFNKMAQIADKALDAYKLYLETRPPTPIEVIDNNLPTRREE